MSTIQIALKIFKSCYLIPDGKVSFVDTQLKKITIPLVESKECFTIIKCYMVGTAEYIRQGKFKAEIYYK